MQLALVKEDTMYPIIYVILIAVIFLAPAIVGMILRLLVTRRISSKVLSVLCGTGFSLFMIKSKWSDLSTLSSDEIPKWMGYILPVVSFLLYTALTSSIAYFGMTPGKRGGNPGKGSVL